jgi:hypothetical protein
VIDPMTKQMVKVNDLAEGKYDVTVTSGPSFSTLRQEAAEVYVSFAQQYPEIMSVAGDLIMKSMDLPYADDISERLRTLLPPQIQEQLDADEEMSPEVQQAMQKVQQAMQMVEEKGQMVLQAEQELEDKKNEVADQERQNDVAAKDVEIRIERLRRRRICRPQRRTAKIHRRRSSRSLLRCAISTTRWRRSCRRPTSSFRR